MLALGRGYKWAPQIPISIAELLGGSLNGVLLTMGREEPETATAHSGPFPPSGQAPRI